MPLRLKVFCVVLPNLETICCASAQFKIILRAMTPLLTLEAYVPFWGVFRSLSLNLVLPTTKGFCLYLFFLNPQ